MFDFFPAGAALVFEVGRLLGETLRIAGDTFPKLIRLESALAEELWSLQADSTQLHQVFLNLLVNARDAVGTRGTIHTYAARGIKVIGVSGYSTSTLEAKALEAGMKHFLLKPYTAQLLLQTISEVLQESLV